MRSNHRYQPSRSASVGVWGRCVAAAAALLVMAATPAAAQPAPQPAPPPVSDPNALPPPPNYPGPSGTGQPVYPGYQPGYAQPYQPPAPPPVYAPAAPTYVAPASYRALRPRWAPQFGLGLRGMGSWNVNSLVDYGQGGVGGELLFRAHPRLTLELAAQYQSTRGDQTALYAGYDRIDAPLTVGLRVHLGNPYWLVSPYLVGAIGADFARVYVPTTTDWLREQAWLFEGGGGGGFELRLGRHVALNMDLRAVARLRTDQKARQQVIDVTGLTSDILGDQFSLQFNVGLAAYF